MKYDKNVQDESDPIIYMLCNIECLFEMSETSQRHHFETRRSGLLLLIVIYTKSTLISGGVVVIKGRPSHDIQHDTVMYTYKGHWVPGRHRYV
jgi:hypothetical protein